VPEHKVEKTKRGARITNVGGRDYDIIMAFLLDIEEEAHVIPSKEDNWISNPTGRFMEYFRKLNDKNFRDYENKIISFVDMIRLLKHQSSKFNWKERFGITSFILKCAAIEIYSDTYRSPFNTEQYYSITALLGEWVKQGYFFDPLEHQEQPLKGTIGQWDKHTSLYTIVNYLDHTPKDAHYNSQRRFYSHTNEVHQTQSRKRHYDETEQDDRRPHKKPKIDNLISSTPPQTGIIGTVYEHIFGLPRWLLVSGVVVLLNVIISTASRSLRDQQSQPKIAILETQLQKSAENVRVVSSQNSTGYFGPSYPGPGFGNTGGFSFPSTPFTFVSPATPSSAGLGSSVHSFSSSEDGCFRCGCPGHWARSCYAKKDVMGNPL